MGGVTKSVKSFAQKVPGVTSLVAGGNGLGAASDLLLGKKSDAVKDSYTPLDPLQTKAINQYGQLMSQDMSQIAKNRVAGQENQIRASGMDTERNAKQLIAQRGLGNSSVGLNAIINSNRDMGDRLNANRATLPGLQYDMKVANLNNTSAGINNILNTRMFKQGQAGGVRQGGLAPLLGMGLGAAFGGPGGASVGGGLGSALTQVA
jgi:hypothetical protein